MVLHQNESKGLKLAANKMDININSIKQKHYKLAKDLKV
jgi:hypothetical protein